ncbi:MAG: hypothetical protein HY901_14345 [Deltaproteobacteria bacterium]|nr:hypothetical protein [Deltaproteobacteria bacterium]
MAALPFQVEFVFAERGFLIARALERSDFHLSEEAALAGSPVVAMEMPRAKAPDGAVRKDLFAFRLKRREDAARFKAGEVVELSGWRE